MRHSLLVFISTFLFSAIFFIGCQKSPDITAPGSDKINPGVSIFNESICENCENITILSNESGQQFKVSFGGMTRNGNLVTFDYEICKSTVDKFLSHWNMDLTGLECVLPANYENFITFNGPTGTVMEINYPNPDPTTGIIGVKFEGFPEDSCLSFSLTFNENFLETGYILDEGCIRIATKTGQGSGNNPVAYGCVPGPVCEPDSNGCEWIGETAWSDGPRYTLKGNWATYTPYVSGSTVTLYAGQTMEAGTVTFSAVTNGEIDITIVLNSGWRLADGVFESVKIQGYENAPSGNPSPGQFTTYKGESLSVTVPLYNFYGVHLDVEWEDCE